MRMRWHYLLKVSGISSSSVSVSAGDVEEGMTGRPKLPGNSAENRGVGDRLGATKISTTTTQRQRSLTPLYTILLGGLGKNSTSLASPCRRRGHSPTKGNNWRHSDWRHRDATWNLPLPMTWERSGEKLLCSFVLAILSSSYNNYILVRRHKELAPVTVFCPASHA